jgi:hypothetical protein
MAGSKVKSNFQLLFLYFFDSKHYIKSKFTTPKVNHLITNKIKMKKKINPLKTLIVGIIIVLAGSFAKIMNENYYLPILSIGLIIELISILLIIKKQMFLNLKIEF